MELLVVLAILGLLASAIVPLGAQTLLRARDRDAKARLIESWKMARVLAIATHRPVVWSCLQCEDGVEIKVDSLDGASPRRFYLEGFELMASKEVEQTKGWNVWVDPSGLSETLKIELKRGSEHFTVMLEGITQPPLE